MLAFIGSMIFAQGVSKRGKKAANLLVGACAAVVLCESISQIASSIKRFKEDDKKPIIIKF